MTSRNIVHHARHCAAFRCLPMVKSILPRKRRDMRRWRFCCARRLGNHLLKVQPVNCETTPSNPRKMHVKGMKTFTCLGKCPFKSLDRDNWEFSRAGWSLHWAQVFPDPANFGDRQNAAEEGARWWPWIGMACAVSCAKPMVERWLGRESIRLPGPLGRSLGGMDHSSWTAMCQ